MVINTGPGDTQPGINFKQGIMRRALNEDIFHIEKLVF